LEEEDLILDDGIPNKVEISEFHNGVPFDRTVFGATKATPPSASAT
jgi:hypothetical protein